MTYSYCVNHLHITWCHVVDDWQVGIVRLTWTSVRLRTRVRTVRRATTSRATTSASVSMVGLERTVRSILMTVPRGCASTVEPATTVLGHTTASARREKPVCFPLSFSLVHLLSHHHCHRYQLVYDVVEKNIDSSSLLCVLVTNIIANKDEYFS